MTRIVVGTDGSQNSLTAMRWAFEEARLRDAIVEVVYAYADPPLPPYPGVVPVVNAEQVRASADKVLEEALDAVASDAEGLKVERTVVAGGAAGVLCERAGDADLVVVGSRGRGGFKGLLLGSVSQQVATHAPCPVVTVGHPPKA